LRSGSSFFVAADVEEALTLGRQEALRFAASGSQPKLLAHLVAFELWETELQSGEEVWSCLRELDLPDERFLDQVYEGERLGVRHSE